jgi:hypothetical protein
VTAGIASPSMSPASTAASSPREAEAARQQALVAALWPAPAALATEAAQQALAAHLDAQAAVPAARGVLAYRNNGGAVAERALGAAFPVLRALIGEDFASFARAFWFTCPPARGDLAELGDALPAFVERDRQLQDVSYLADVARLERVVARAESAADDLVPRDAGLASLQRLADTDPSRLRLRLAPGAAVVRSRWPVASIWRAHEAPGPRAADAPLAADAARLARVRAMLAAGEGECAFAWRAGWRVQVTIADAATAAFLEALVAGSDLAAALDRADAVGEFTFDAWLAQALANGALRGAEPVAPPGDPPGPDPDAGAPPA